MNTILKKIITVFLVLVFFTNPSNTQQSPSTFADLVEKLTPAVVNISATRVIETKQNPFPFQFPPGSPFEDFFKEFDQGRTQKRKTTALGSGFIIDKDGTIITNNHVVQSAEGILIKLTNGKEYEAKLLGTDKDTDIAVLKINTKDKISFVNFADSDRARVGDWVIAIGNPFGLGGTVTKGIISARNRDINMGRIDDFIQTDAPINQGNSGGPLFNMKGEVVGINTAIFSQSGGSVGIGFAIPANSAKKVIDQIAQFGETKRGYIGVRIQDVTKEIAESLGLKNQEGSLISSVAKGGPADKAGIEAGDVVLEFDGKKVESTRKLQRIVGETPIKKSVEIKVWRNKKLLSKQINVERLEEAAEYKESQRPVASATLSVKELGVKIRNISQQDVSKRQALKDKNGVIISEIEKDGPVSLLPINEGDVIVAVANVQITNTKTFDDLFKRELRKNLNSVLLTIFDTNNQTKFIGVKIK
jgi:serine protease Do